MKRAIKLEHERQRLEWEAEQDRVQSQGNLFSAIPNSPEKTRLLSVMVYRTINLYNECRYQEGDAILEFLPNDLARELLDWYFDDNAQDPFAPKTAAIENENPQQGEIQSEPQQPSGANG